MSLVELAPFYFLLVSVILLIFITVPALRCLLVPTLLRESARYFATYDGHNSSLSAIIKGILI